MFMVVQFGLKDCRVWIGGDMILERGEVELDGLKVFFRCCLGVIIKGTDH